MTQEGNSLEMSLVLSSFLIGFGFDAYVVCGQTDRDTAMMDRTKTTCDLLKKESVGMV